MGMLAPLLAGLSLLLLGCEPGAEPASAPNSTSATTTHLAMDININITTTTTATGSANATATSTTSATTTPQRIGSFLVIGDWGWDPQVHGNVRTVDCQRAIAEAMAAKVRELGDVRFVINVGDSFYPGGVGSRSDPQWETKWRSIFPPETRSVPWYSVYGNHDYAMDPCACSNVTEDCAQINRNVSDLDYFYMPDSSYYIEHPELGIEVVGLDMNYYTWVNHTCRWTPCQEVCHQNLKERHDAAFELFYERAEKSAARNLVVFSHYPTDYFWAFPDFLAELSNATEHHVEYFGGHRHNVDQRSCTSTAPNSNWVVGGGGGWGCEGWYGREQGFLVGEVGLDYNLRTYPVLVNYSICCSD